MWDAAGSSDESGAPARNRGVAAAQSFEARTGARQTTMATRVRGAALEVVPDQRILADRRTKFPVYVDPRWGGRRQAWTWVYDRFPDQRYMGSNDIARVGFEGETSGVARSFFRMDTSRTRGKQIIRATLQTHETHSWSCTKRWVELWSTGAIGAATTWNNQPRWATKLSAQNVAYGWGPNCPDHGVDFDATAAVAAAARTNLGNITLGLRATDESDVLRWKKFANNPTLTIEYDSYPNVPRSLSTSPGTACVNGKLTNSDITLRAIPSDPDGGGVAAIFDYWRAGVASTSRTVSVTSGNLASTRILKTALVDGATYNWRVRTSSTGDLSAYSPTCTFTVDKTLPTPDVDVASAEYPPYEPDSTVSTVPAGTPGQFTINAKGDRDVVGFFIGIDDDAPTRYVALNTPGGSATVKLTPTSAGPEPSTSRRETLLVISRQRSIPITHSSPLPRLVLTRTPGTSMETATPTCSAGRPTGRFAFTSATVRVDGSTVPDAASRSTLTVLATTCSARATGMATAGMT